MPHALQFLVLAFAGWGNRHQDILIDGFLRFISQQSSVVAPRPSSAGRLAALGARRGFHHGLPGDA